MRGDVRLMTDRCCRCSPSINNSSRPSSGRGARGAQRTLDASFTAQASSRAPLDSRGHLVRPRAPAVTGASQSGHGGDWWHVFFWFARFTFASHLITPSNIFPFESLLHFQDWKSKKNPTYLFHNLPMQCPHIAGFFLLHSQSETQILVFFCEETDKEGSKFPFAEIFTWFTIGVCFQILFLFGKNIYI